MDPHSDRRNLCGAEAGDDNWRWQGVPFYLRSGKSLAKRVTEINVQFKHVPASIF